MMKKPVVFVTQLRAGYGIDVVGCFEDKSELLVNHFEAYILSLYWQMAKLGGSKELQVFFTEVVCPELCNFRREREGREVCEVTPFYLMVCFI